MLSAQEIANYLVEKLDAIGATRPEGYAFSILAETAKGYDGIKINGMVKTVSPDLAPYPAGYIEANYVYVVEIFVSGAANKRYLNISSILNEFFTANQASTVEFANGKGVLTFTMGVPKGYKIEYELGEGVPLTFTVHVTYTENGVTSGDKHWLLDGVEIPFLSESVSVEREGIPRKIYTEVYSKILLTGQTKFYTFRIPYESNTFKSLQSEILQAPAINAAVHTLTYYDGAAFTQDKPYTAKVSIYRSASSNSTRPNAAAYDVTFTDVYDSNGKALKYYISLIDFPFDMQGDDTRYFNSTAEQVQYFEDKAAASSAPFIEIEAPNLDGLVITKQVYRAPDAAALSQFDYVSKNYAVVKVVSATKTQYFYYFIENATIGADGCVMVDLKMDTVQTFFFNPEITFSDCLIERAHLNRFVPVEDDESNNLVKFVTDPASKIYNSEEGLNFPKRLVQRDKLKLRFTGNDEVDEWLNENVAYWVYVFLDPTKNYKISADSDKTISFDPFGKVKYLDYDFKSVTACICYPTYKNLNTTGARIIFRGASQQDDWFMELAKENFERLNNDTSYYYSIKLSNSPPFTSFKGVNYEIIEHPYPASYPSNILFIDCTQNQQQGYATFGEFGAETHVLSFGSLALIFGAIQNNKYISSIPYVLSENGSFHKLDILKKQPPKLAYNPKLNGQNFKELTITSASGDTFSYDIQKLNDDSITFEYSEPITPEITKYYMRVKGGTGLYEEGTDENYTGLVGSTDNSLAYTNDQYANFIANNKNFYLQSNMKITAGIGQSTATGAQSGAAAGPIGVLAGAAQGFSTGANQAISSVIDRSLTIDNMKNAPDQLKNANGNAIFNMFCTDLGLYVEKYSALEGDLKTANDFMNLYGFTFSSIANVRDYVHIRKYHNYIKAQLQSINGNVSNTVRADLRQRFANGIRFWNSDKVDYSYENYELWLETY